MEARLKIDEQDPVNVDYITGWLLLLEIQVC